MKDFTDEELKTHLNTAVRKLAVTLQSFYTDNRRRAILLGYWIQDYVRYLRKEDKFQFPKHKYNRGDIVQVNFGYRVGRELGGRHFAVVLDNDNDMKSDIVTVVPLNSLKSSSKVGKYAFVLKKGIFILCDEKFNKKFEKAKLLNDEITKMIGSKDVSKISEIEEKLSKLERDLTALEILKKAISKLKNGTVVNVSQVATISKMRISNPKMAKDSLNGIKLDTEDLDRLNDYLKRLYIK